MPESPLMKSCRGQSNQEPLGGLADARAGCRAGRVDRAGRQAEPDLPSACRACANAPAVRKGLLLLSAPTVVDGPCPGSTTASSGLERIRSWIEPSSWANEPPGRSVL